MYKIGELFVYGSRGACKIIDIKNEKFGNSEKTYYILMPFFDSKETIFVPVDNEKLVSKNEKNIVSQADGGTYKNNSRKRKRVDRKCES